MNTQETKEKSPYRGLLLIPIMIGVTYVLFWIAGFIDGHLIPWDQESLGHPVPVFTALTLIVMPFVDLVVSIISIIVTIVRVKRKGQ